MPYPNEWSCRLKDPSGLKIVGSKNRRHDGKPYRVIFGIPKSGGGSVEQAYRYSKDSWSREQAAAHCRSHDGRFEAALEGEGLELVYMASVHSIETGDEQHMATFYLMNTSRNRNQWGVTDKALEDALPTLLTKPIGVGPGYQADQHYAEPLVTGRFIKVEKPDGYALGTVEITDPQVWAMLNEGTLGPISVVISSYRETCSACGQLLTGAENPFEHECIVNNDAYIRVESFTFNRVDFVNVPAYPQAGLLEIAADAQQAVVPLELLAGFYQAQTVEPFKQEGSQTSQSSNDLGRGAGSPGQSPTTRIKRQEKPRMETEEEAVANVKELEATVDALTQERDELKTQLEHPETDPELEQVKAELSAMKQDIHDQLVAAAVDARFEAGLIAKKEDETAQIDGYSDEMLNLLIEDARKIAAKLEAAKPTGPKARYGQTETDAFTKAVEDQREALYGYRRDTEGKVMQ